MTIKRKLLHEVWEEVGPNSKSLHSLALAGPRGDQQRQLIGPNSRLVTTLEASSHFEAMTLYYQIMGWGEYTTDQSWDHQSYPDEWFDEQRA